MSIVVEIGILYQEHMIREEVARENFRRKQTRIRMFIILKIGILYQEHMILEEEARENFGHELIEN